MNYNVKILTPQITNDITVSDTEADRILQRWQNGVTVLAVTDIAGKIYCLRAIEAMILEACEQPMPFSGPLDQDVEWIDTESNEIVLGGSHPYVVGAPDRPVNTYEEALQVMEELRGEQLELPVEPVVEEKSE